MSRTTGAIKRKAETDLLERGRAAPDWMGGEVEPRQPVREVEFDSDSDDVRGDVAPAVSGLVRFMGTFDLLLGLGLYLFGQDVLNLSCTSVGMREACEPLFLALWKWCPRITTITRGSLSEDQAFMSWLTLTQMGRILPFSKRSYQDLLASDREVLGLHQYTKHSHMWANDEAAGIVCRWFQVVYGGMIVRDADVFDTLAVLELLMGDLMARSIPEVLHEVAGYRHRTTTRTNCGMVHEQSFVNRKRKEAALWAYDASQSYVEGTQLLLKNKHKVDRALCLGSTFAVKFDDREGTLLVESYVEYQRLKVLCNHLDKLAIKAIRVVFDEMV